MVSLLPIAGTWSWRGETTRDWWTPGSPWLEYLSGHGLTHLWPGDPFVWTTHLAGTAWASHTEWQCAGKALRYYLQNPLAPGPDYEVPRDDRRLVCHSHGLQPVLYAASGDSGRAEPCYIHRLISVGSPVRQDMAQIAKLARPHIGQWLHIASPGWSDRMQWLGELFDGRFKVQRTHPLADVNDLLPKIGHSRILKDSTQFALWDQQGWAAFLKS